METTNATTIGAYFMETGAELPVMTMKAKERKNNLPRQIIDVPVSDIDGNPVYGDKREAILNWL